MILFTGILAHCFVQLSCTCGGCFGLGEVVRWFQEPALRCLSDELGVLAAQLLERASGVSGPVVQRDDSWYIWGRAATRKVSLAPQLPTAPALLPGSSVRHCPYMLGLAMVMGHHTMLCTQGCTCPV